MTATLTERPPLTVMSEDELAALITTGTDAERDAASAEVDAREAKARRAAAARSRARERYTEWESAAYANYQAADRYTRGNMLSERGKLAGRDPWPWLWMGEEARARLFASEDLLRFWEGRATGRPPSPQEYVRARKAAEREAQERQAAAMGTKTVCEHPARRTGLCRGCPRAATAAGGPAPDRQQRIAGLKAAAAVLATPAGIPAATPPRPLPPGLVKAPAGVAVRDTGTVTATPAGRPEVDPAELLRRVLEGTGLFFTDYVAFPSRSTVIAVILWAAHAAARDSERELIWRASPRLLLTSAENGSGKSTVLDALALLLGSRAGRLVKVTPYGLAGILGKYKEVALPDDAQTVFGTTGTAAKDLLAVLLGSYVRGGTWTSGKSNVTIEGIYGPVALAGKDALITKQASALTDLLARSIIVRLERATRYMPELDEDGETRAVMLGKALTAVMGALQPQLREAARDLAARNRGQVITDGDGGRVAQIWRPLLAVAQVAGAPWVEAARQAMDELAAASGDLLAAQEALTGLEGLEGIGGLPSEGRSFWDEPVGA